MAFSDYDAASLCRSLYAFAGDAPIVWDFLDLSDTKTGIAWGVKAGENGVDNLVLRGTSDFQDAWRDIELFPAKPSGRYAPIGEVHGGFFEDVPRVVDTILARNPKGNICIMGHSLGAAHAQLVSECLACWGMEVPVFLFGEPPSTRKDPRSARSWCNGSDPITAPPLWPYTRRKGLLMLNEPPADDDDWGEFAGWHHIEKYQAGLAKLQAPAPIIVNTEEAAMTDVFDTAFQNLLGWEGGYGNAAHDDGGPTNLGVIQTEYDAYRKRVGELPQSVKYITKAEAEDIYRNEYWDATLCGRMNPGVANCVFDADVNSGDRRGVEWLQAAINQVCGKPFVTVDGKPGPATVAAANQFPPDKIIDALLNIRLAFMKVCRNKEGELLWPTFGRGWNDRIIGVRKQSHALAGLPAPAAPLAAAASSPTPSQLPPAQPSNLTSSKTMEPAMTAAATTVSATVPVASSSVVIPTTINNLMTFITMAATFITTSGIDFTSVVGTLSHGNFWAGLLATGAAAAVKHVMVTNSNSATISAIANAASAGASIVANAASAVQSAAAQATQAGSVFTSAASANPTTAAAS